MNNDRIGFFGALALLFIGLKLGGVIDWSWWYVLGPIWVPAAVALVALFLIWILEAISHRT